MPQERRSGVLLHPTSLPGPFGSGELGSDAIRWLDFLVDAGQRVWQVLPLGPTGYGDSPYQSFSSFAGNPNLISLERLAADGLLSATDLADAPVAAPRVDFGSMIGFRRRALTRAAETWRASADAAERAAFAAFVRASGAWLQDYALFTALKDAHGGQSWATWPEPLRRRKRKAVAEATERHADAILDAMLLQWWFDRHWRDVREAAADRDVTILGDLPIFVAYDSADTWAAQELFHLTDLGEPTVVAGVPPDYFSITGQRWGNPLYRWKKHAKQGYRWWIERVRRNLELVDWLRIDHFRGFEAYWEIPASEPTAVAGAWVQGPGQALFDALRAELGSLPIVAEDLGVITPAVERLRDRNGLPGMKVLQFAFASDADDPYLPHNYPVDAIVYTGTHDNDTTTGWYETAPEVERDLVRRYLASDGSRIAYDLWRLGQASVAHTAIAPLQDLLALGAEGRMNTPGAASGNWGWRFAWDDLPAWLTPQMRETALLFGRLPGAGVIDTPYRRSTLEEAPVPASDA